MADQQRARFDNRCGYAILLFGAIVLFGYQYTRPPIQAVRFDPGVLVIVNNISGDKRRVVTKVSFQTYRRATLVARALDADGAILKEEAVLEIPGDRPHKTHQFVIDLRRMPDAVRLVMICLDIDGNPLPIKLNEADRSKVSEDGESYLLWRDTKAVEP